MKALFQMAVVLLGVAMVVSGCGGGGGGSQIASNSDLRDTSVDTSDILFEADRVMHIDIEMDPGEYQTLRGDGRTMAHFAMNCEDEFEWIHFQAKVSVDGEVLDNVDIRKKGFLGSLTASRPSFKLDFDTHVPGRRFKSLERMTLNNNRQDPGNARQCISYDMFRAVGLPAPRCGYARVTMNGEDLGVYSHVESVKKHFLRRNFSSDAGNLFEAQLADFGEYTKENYQLKTEEARGDRSDLDRVVEALSADDYNMPGLLGQVVDLERFLDFWAMEAITGHWDGATGNANNHLVYRDPNSNLFSFIPWGTDGTFSLVHPLNLGTGPLFRYTNIPNRLYGIPEYREKFHERVLALLDVVWKPNALNAELDRIRDLTGSREADMRTARNFIAKQEARLRASISGDLVQRESLIEDVPSPCQKDVVTQLTGSFSDGVGQLEFIDENGELVSLSGIVQPSTAINQNGLPFAFDSFFITVVAPDAMANRVISLSVERSEFAVGEVALQGGNTALYLAQFGANAQDNFVEALGGPGKITFTEQPVLGSPASFEISAELWFIGDAVIRGVGN